MVKNIEDFGLDPCMLAEKNLGAIAAFLGKPRELSATAASRANRLAWFAGYDEAKAYGSLRELLARLQSTRISQ